MPTPLTITQLDALDVLDRLGGGSVLIPNSYMPMGF